MNVSFRWLFFFVFAAGAFFLSFLASPTAQAAPLAQIKNVRVHADKEKVRIVVDADGEVDYKSMTLASPGRVVVDISGARISPSVAKSQKSPSFASRVLATSVCSLTLRQAVHRMTSCCTRHSRRANSPSEKRSKCSSTSIPSIA